MTHRGVSHEPKYAIELSLGRPAPRKLISVYKTAGNRTFYPTFPLPIYSTPTFVRVGVVVLTFCRKQLFFGTSYLGKFFFEGSYVLEALIDTGEADVSHLIDFGELAHNDIADLCRSDLGLATRI